MEIYNSEQEQVEALKAWWDKNGRSALAALALFLLAVLGWQGWMDHRNQLAEAASAHYQQMMDLMGRDASQATEAGRALIASYPGSVYASMAAMALAKLAVEQKDLDAAAAHLRAAMTQTDQPELALLARQRLARVELAQGKHEEALATLNAGDKSAASDELRGDILLVQGKREEARTAYVRALDGYGNASDKRESVQMKIDDLAAGAVKAETPAE